MAMIACGNQQARALFAQMPVERQRRIGLFAQAEAPRTRQQGMMHDPRHALAPGQRRHQLHCMTLRRQIGRDQPSVAHDAGCDQRMNIDADQRPRRSHSTTCAPRQRAIGSRSR